MSIYRPRRIRLKNMILAFTPLLVIVAISFAFKAANPLSFFEGFLILILFFGTLVFLGFNYTYVEIQTDKIKFVKFLIFRNNINISSIQSLKYRSFGTKSLDGITIHYTSKNGFPMSAVLGSIGAYGPNQIATILNEISKSNHSIQMDSRVAALR